ncbi:protein mini spindles isoform X4 [Drosophila miranda]|uniref:protein mini spindles isoform X4 n=1 Tax=Drosophila miranda TaxID=7229 RepID=UPI00143F1A12|nr:protein mini spindles isoform X4 [Drosophila miranda]
MAEDTEYKKLPVEERCVHKLWKARVDGYEEAAKLFRELDDEKSPEWSKFAGLIKKMVVDSNALAQEKGLEAALIFVENSGLAGRTVGDVMSGIVQKCIAAPKTKTKELSVLVTLMYVEIEKQEAVVEELVKGMDHKNPKIVSACVAAVTLALREFGSKVVGVKPLIKKLAPLMSERDKAVRDEGKQLAVEIYRWIGAAMKAQIATLPQVTLKELEDEFEKLKGERAEPSRYLKSQQEKQAKIAETAASDDVYNEEDGDAGTEEMDPMDLLDPVDILSKMPKDFYEKLEEKKWTLRKEALEALEKLLTDHPKLESGEYGTLVNALRKVITKDSNVVLVALAGKCVAMLAKGLVKRFSNYASGCVPSLLEKFKEKKPNVVAALREAMDAIYMSTSLEAQQEAIVESLANKNPTVKSETALFLARALCRTQPTALNKKLLKLIATNLVKTLNEPDPTVRDSSAEALGTLMKLVGEKTLEPLLADVDPLKMSKIKECYEKAEIKVKIVGPKKETRPASAPQTKAGGAARPTAGSAAPKAVARPATSGARKLVKKNPAAAAPAAAAASKAANAKALATERDMPAEEVQDKAEEMLPAEILSGLVDSNWKTRLAAVEQLQGEIPSYDAKQPGISQMLVRTVSGRKPGLKEMNFQVLKLKLDIIRSVAETYPLTTITVDHVINEITEKLADAKNGPVAGDVLSAFAEATKLEYVVGKVLGFAFEQKSPKVQSEAFNWVAKAITEFGFQMQPKLLIEEVRKGVQSTNPTVRGAAILLVGTMSMYTGQSLMMFFDGEKPALKVQIQTEFDKNVGEKPPRPVRGAQRGSGGGAGTPDGGDDDDDAGGQDEDMACNMADLLPRVDIAPQITEALLKEMSDKDWKIRNEGLTKLQTIISEARLIKPSIGDLGPALAHRLVDSNAKIAQTTLSICEQLATAMGSGCRNHVRTLFPGFLHALGHGKDFVRAAALSCINTFGEKGGYKEFFESEMIADALKGPSTALKVELWAWLADKLPGIPPKTISKEDLNSMVPQLYAHICDRTADVRKNANEAVLGVMIHLGFEAMNRALDKQKPASKAAILASLEKARPNLPVKPLPKGKQQAPILEDSVKKTVRGRGTIGGAAAQKAPNARATVAGEKAAVTSRKKDEDVDTSPLLAVNTAKNQRLLDEQKMRVLKWTFTTPREEFSELLREQMTAASVNKALMANMFHDDFRYHLKVIEQLSDDLPSNGKALICNLDLILKWLTLRFYDTNPSVLLKGLDYLMQVFQMLVEVEYILGENEVASFVPHLLLKIGDPKDTVRNGVRRVLRHVLLVYPYSKIFPYVMDGLKSKNARQRTECLDELTFLVESYGVGICSNASIKDISRQISDRDNSVRNAALNCMVQVFFLTGEKLYKQLNHLNEKDLSMLDERIKRAKKTYKPPSTAPPEMPSGGGKVAAPPRLQQQESIEIEDAVVGNGYGDELPPTSDGTFDQAPSSQLLQLQQQLQHLQQQSQQQRPSGPFGLDPQVIAEIEKDWVRVDDMKFKELPSVDISLLYEPIKVIPTNGGVYYPQDKFDRLISRQQYMPQTITTSPSANASMASGISPYRRSLRNQQQQHQNHMENHIPNLADVLPKHDPQLVKVIKAVSSMDTMKARAAINELAAIIESPEKQAVLRDYEDIFIHNVLEQLKHLSQQPTAQSLVMYQPLLSILYTFFHANILGKTLGVTYIKHLMSALLHLMADPKLANGEDGQYNKVINGICLKVLEKVNFTNLNCALIRLLRETCPVAGLPKFTDLLMKCIWRNVKMLPERSNELNYDDVILEAHEFMLALPSTWWQNRPSDTPLRTVKTIVHNMAKVKGNAILQHLNQIPTHSELHTYLIRILKNFQKDGSSVGTGASPQRAKEIASKRISHQTHDTVSQIFKLISDRDTKQQGLQKLYDFKQQNPDIDLSSFLQGSSATFHKYIEEGLAEIERSQNGMPGSAGQAPDNRLAATRSYLTDANHQNLNHNQNAAGERDADFWMDRLQYLMGGGVGVGVSVSGKMMSTRHTADDGSRVMMDNKVADENLCLNSGLGSQKASLIRREKPDVSPNRLQHIQAKLAQIKKESHAQ